MSSTATRSRPHLHPILALLGFLAVMYGAGALGAFVTYPEIGGWYAQLPKPAWTPPDRVFAPVWNTIFLLTAVSGWLCWRESGFDPTWVLPYGLQVYFNVLWSVVFFGLHSPASAVAVIAALLGALLYLFRAAWPIRPLAALLLAPYIAWVSFAAALNLAIAGPVP